MNSGVYKILTLFLIFIVVVAVSLFSVFSDHKSSSGTSEIEAVVQKYLEEHPELVVKALENYQQKQVQDQAKKSQEQVSAKREQLERDSTSPVVGNPLGDVTVVEFFDYACGFCHKAFSAVSDIVKTDENVRLVMKEFPILGPSSVTAAKAAIAVSIVQPQKYFDFHAALMQANIRGGEEAIWQAAQSVGVDVAQVKQKMADPEVQKVIDQNQALATEIGVRGTPAFVINGEFIPGYVEADVLKEKIKSARGNKKSDLPTAEKSEISQDSEQKSEAAPGEEKPAE